MSEHIDKTIAELQRHIADLDEQANDAKKTINSLCKVIGRPVLYDSIDEQSTVLNAPLQGDEYYNRPLATVVKEILEGRRSIGAGPATLDELFETMIEGGFQFSGASKRDDFKRRGLSIALAKNQAFHKLPNGKIGLRDWYNVKESKSTTNGNGSEPEREDEIETAENQEPAKEDAQDLAETVNKPR